MRSRAASLLQRVARRSALPWAAEAGICTGSCRILSTLAARTSASSTLVPCSTHRPASYALTWMRAYASLPSHRLLEMPALSPTMSQGNIATWRKKEGEAVAAGDVLAEVETDKATIDWESMDDGFVAKILVPEGSKDVAVGTPVAIVVEDESDIAAFADYQAGTSAAAPAAAAATAPAASAPAAGSFPAHVVMAMPALSPTMAQGNVAAFRKAVGDEVAAGDSLAEIETDKATMDWESQDDGVVAKWLVEEGARDIAVGTPVLVMVDSKDDVAAFAGFTAASAGAAAAAPKAAAPQAAAPAQAPTPAAAPKAAAPKAAPRAAPGSRVIASPLAKKMALEAGVGLAGVAGSGPGGRIVAADVERLIASGGGAPAASATAAASGPFVDIVNSNIRKVIAERLQESKQQVPHYYLTVDVRMDTLLKLRAQLNTQLAPVKLSVNDFVIKAAAMACKKVPEANSAWMGDFIRQYNTVDCSVAVQTPVGLMVPIVKDADTKGLLAISADVKSLAARAKEGKLQPADYQGGTFTISNLGMFGVGQFAAIVNPPQACILAVGTTSARVVLDNGTPVNAQFMSVTLSADHRVADGAVGAEWLKAFKQHMENPVTMLL